MAKCVSALSMIASYSLISFIISCIVLQGVFAQGSNSSYENFRVLVSIYGLTPSLPEMFVFATVENHTQGTIVNTTKIDLANSNNNSTDGIAETTLVFHNVTVEPGEKFRTCVLVPSDLRLLCQDGFNSPVVRTEFATISIPPK
jgi:hypothetical protein